MPPLQPLTRKGVSNVLQRFADEFGRLAIRIETDHMEFSEIYKICESMWRDLATLLSQLKHG